MSVKQRSCLGVKSDALRDPCDMAKAELPESQSPDDETRSPPERHMLPAPRSATTSFAGCRNLRGVERCPVRAIKEISAAPRGALLYPRFSREELGEMFLDLMPNPESKDKRDRSLAANQRSCPGVWNDALGDPRDMVKAGLPDSLVSRRRNSSSAGKTSVTGASPVAASYSGRCNLQNMERCPMRAFKDTNGTPKSRYTRIAGTNVGSPTGRESQGDGVPIVVVRVTPHQGGRESRPQGEGAQATGHQRPRGMRNADRRNGTGCPTVTTSRDGRWRAR